MATLPQLSESMSAAQFAQQANNNFSTVMTAAENAGSSSGGGGETSDIQRTIKMQMQGGRLVNGWQNTTRGDDYFFKYLHTTLMLSVENSTLVSVDKDNEETLTIFCYAGNGSYLGSTNLESSLPNGTCFVRFMLSKSSAYSNVKMLEVTIKGFPKFVKNDVYSRVSVNEFMFETIFPKNYEPTDADSRVSGSPAKSYMGTGNTRYYDWGFINLPPNYTIDGTPVPLVVYVHGTNGYYWSSGPSNTYRELQNFIVNNGFALCDCCGLTNGATTADGNVFEAPSFMTSITNMVKFLSKNYNICDDGVYIYGKSAAGFIVHLFSIYQPFKIRAIGSFAPAISPLASTPTHITNNGPSVVNNVLRQLDIIGDGNNEGVDANFKTTESQWSYIIGTQAGKHGASETDYTNLSKWRRIDPFFANTDMTDEEVFNIIDTTFGFKYKTNNVIYQAPWDLFMNIGYYNESTETTDSTRNLRNLNMEVIADHKRWCAVPTKIWIDAADTRVSYTMSKVFVDMAKRTGSPCFLRSMPYNTGGHFSVDTSETAVKVDYASKYAGVVNVPIAYAELVDWFNRW